MSEVSFPARMLHVGMVSGRESRVPGVYVDSKADSLTTFSTDGKCLVLTEKKQESGPAMKACIPTEIASLAIKMAICGPKDFSPTVTLIVNGDECRLQFRGRYVGHMGFNWSKDDSTQPPYRDVIPKNTESVSEIGFTNAIISKVLATIKKLSDEPTVKMTFFGKNKAAIVRGQGGPFETMAVVMPCRIDL